MSKSNFLHLPSINKIINVDHIVMIDEYYQRSKRDRPSVRITLIDEHEIMLSPGNGDIEILRKALL